VSKSAHTTPQGSPATSAPAKAQPYADLSFVMNPHVVSAKALNQTTTKASWSKWRRTGRGFRLQLSRAIPIHGGCLTEFSTNENHQRRSVVSQPLWLRTPRIAPSTVAPLVLLNRRVARFTSGPRKHVISNPFLTKSGLANVTTFLEAPSCYINPGPGIIKNCLQLAE
jgi:hypothetical protein